MEEMTEDERPETWGEKELGLEEDDRVRFTYRTPRSEEPQQKTGEVTSTGRHLTRDTVAYVDIDDAGKWILQNGKVLIYKENHRHQQHGTLIDVEKIPRVGMKAIAEREVDSPDAWNKPIVGEVTEVMEEKDKVRFQREFDETNLTVRFDELTEVK